MGATGGGRDEEQAGLFYALRLHGVRKLFPAKRDGGAPLQAVKSLSVGLPRGELFGLLGANGAGKTTAIAMVMRALYPNAGGIEIEGHSVLSNFKAASKKLGVVTQHNTLWDHLSGADHLRLFARLRGVPASAVGPLVAATVAQMELGPYAERLAGQLSGGMKRKLVTPNCNWPMQKGGGVIIPVLAKPTFLLCQKLSNKSGL